MSELFFIVANQRTGTNYLRDRLNRDTNIHAMGEVFFPGFDTACNYDGHFFEYFLSRIQKDKKSILITDTNVFDSLINDYFDALKDVAPREYVCVDIKSDCFRLLPRLYEIIDSRGEKILHLRRRDKLARAISQILLNMNYYGDNRYRLFGEAKVEVVELPYDLVLENIIAAEGFDRFIESRYPTPLRRKTLVYEDLTAGPEAWMDALAFVGAKGEIRIDTLSTQRKDLGGTNRVSNYNELATRLLEKGVLSEFKN